MFVAMISYAMIQIHWNSPKLATNSTPLHMHVNRLLEKQPPVAVELRLGLITGFRIGLAPAETIHLLGSLGKHLVIR